MNVRNAKLVNAYPKKKHKKKTYPKKTADLPDESRKKILPRPQYLANTMNTHTTYEHQQKSKHSRIQGHNQLSIHVCIDDLLGIRILQPKDPPQLTKQFIKHVQPKTSKRKLILHVVGTGAKNNKL